MLVLVLRIWSVYITDTSDKSTTLRVCSGSIPKLERTKYQQDGYRKQIARQHSFIRVTKCLAIANEKKLQLV